MKIKFDSVDFKRAVRDAAENQLQQRIEQIRCPEHGLAATIRQAGEEEAGKQYVVSACCESQRQRVLKEFGKSTGEVQQHDE